MQETLVTAGGAKDRELYKVNRITRFYVRLPRCINGHRQAVCNRRCALNTNINPAQLCPLYFVPNPNPADL